MRVNLEIIWFAARCQKCGETFRPVHEDDLNHLVTYDGRECDGQGKMLGYGGRVR